MRSYQHTTTNRSVKENSLLICRHVDPEKQIWAASWQNQQNDCAPSEDSDQPGHPPSLTRVFSVHRKKAWVLSYPLNTQWRLWSDWADAQADLSLRWVHSHFVGFVIRQLIWYLTDDKLVSIFLHKNHMMWVLNGITSASTHKENCWN